MDVCHLFPETKTADARKYSVSGNHWLVELHDQCLKLRPHLNFVLRSLEPIQRHVFSIYTSSSNTLSPFHIFTCRANTFSPVWLSEWILSLSHIHQQPSNATKCIVHANISFLSISCLWDFFQPRKQQLHRTTERNEHLEIRSQHEWDTYYLTLSVVLIVLVSHTHTHAQYIFTNNNRTIVMF